MRIPKTLKVITIVSGIAAAAGEGGCVARQIYRNEPVDKFVKCIDSNSVDVNSKNYRIKEFTQSLLDNQEALKEGLGISDDDYKFFSKLAIGIAKNETLNGLGEGYCWKKNAPFFAKIGRAIALKGDTSMSLGMTNLKFGDLGTGEREKMKLFGVISKNIFDPKKSAIATIIHLNYLKNGYQTYLENRAKEKGHIKLELEEYLAARWKGLPNYKTIIADRTAKKPKDDAWKVLRSIGYEYNADSNTVEYKAEK